MRTSLIVAVMSLLPIGFDSRPAPVAPPPPQASARQLLDQAITAMGGEARLTSIRSLALDSIGHAWALEQSERPEGPWLAIYRQRVETRDYARNRRTLGIQQRFWSSAQWSPAATLVVSDGVAASTNGQRWAPASPMQVAEWEETAALAPERVLMTARSAGDARVLPDETHQRVKQNPVAFSWNGLRLKLFLNAWTHLPTGLEVVKNDRFGIWGDVTERRWYSYWTLEAGGLMYPRQTTVEWNGLPYSDDTVMALTVDGAVDDAAFAVPEDVKQKFQALAQQAAGLGSMKLDESRAVAINDWVLQLPGGFNVGVVRQPDGLVILESTTSTSYSRQVLDFVAKRFPNVAVKAVVTTSDAWPHVGGIREYAASGIPIYPLDLNVSILTRIIEAPRAIAPDPVRGARRAPVFRPVSSRTAIGTGETRVELIPVRGEYGERMMLAWLPGARLLYSSDLIQPDRPGTGFFMPAMLAEVVGAVERERITGIDQVFGMHLRPTPWQRVVDAVQAARAGARVEAKWQ